MNEPEKAENTVQQEAHEQQEQRPQEIPQEALLKIRVLWHKKIFVLLEQYRDYKGLS